MCILRTRAVIAMEVNVRVSRNLIVILNDEAGKNSQQ